MKIIRFISVLVCVMTFLTTAKCSCNFYSPENLKKEETRNNANRAKALAQLEKRVLNLKPGSTIQDTRKAFGSKGIDPCTIQIDGNEYLCMVFPVGRKFHRDGIGYWYYGIFKNNILYSIIDKPPYEQDYLISDRKPLDPNIVVSTKGLFRQDLINSLRKNFPREKYYSSNLPAPIPVLIVWGLADSMMPKPAHLERKVPSKLSGNKKRVNVSAKANNGVNPLYFAACNGDTDAIKTLVVNGADVNAGVFYEETPLHYATANNQKEAAEVLLANGANINAKDHWGWTPLHIIVHCDCDNRKELVEFLIAHGADINAKDNNGQTPLHIIAQYGCDNEKELIEILVTNGADINARDNLDKTPLHYASLSLEMCKVLIANGADINAKDIEGQTILQKAAYWGDSNIKVVEFLVENGADVNAKDIKGQTVLHFAVSWEGLGKKTFEFLVQNGADISAKDNYGNTALR